MHEVLASDLMPDKARGERHPAAKLSDDSVRSIRGLYREGAAIMALARHYGVSATTIRCVLLGKTWRHVE